jgi:hypothetical protein
VGVAITEGDVNLPGLGKIDKKYAIAGTLVAVGLGVIVYIRSRNAASTAAAADTAAAGGSTPDDGTDESGIDPATGIPYAEEDSGDYGDDGGGDYAEDDTDLDAAGYPIGSAQDLAYEEEQSTGIETNDEWLEAAISGDVPGTASAIQAACAAVLAGLTVTTAQKDLFLEAVGILGQPPQGYPTPIKTSDTASQSSSSSGNVSVPHTEGGTAGEAHDLIVAVGLVPKAATASQKPSDIVTGTSPSAGTSVASGSKVTITAKAGNTATEVTVPKTVGDTAGTAHDKISAAGLEPVAAASQEPSMKVISTAPAGGAKAAKGTRVVINAK